MPGAEPGPDLEPENPGWFESWGVRAIARLQKKVSGEPAKTDEELTDRVRRITYQHAFFAFLVGAISAAGTVITEELYEHDPAVLLYTKVAVVTGVLTAIEFIVLFYLSLRTVHCISVATGHARFLFEKEDPVVALPNMLARAALEIPDPVRRALGINPLARVSRWKLLLLGLLYKMKIMASNTLAKLLLRRLFGKSLFRFSVAYIAVPITGLWNAFVIWKVARDARLRLAGHLMVQSMGRDILTAEDLGRLSERARMACLRAVGNSVVLTQNSHPNMLVLLLKMFEILERKRPDRLDDWEYFLSELALLPEAERFFVLDLLCVATAFDGKMSRLERRLLPQAFGTHTPLYFQRIERLRRLLIQGKVRAALLECRLDFRPA
ncbi:MAG: hypothetical protein HS115_05315 [Spirochaetales bacterium]|nr:hypothetical protein [Spirochaetales bacterium]